MLGLIYCFIILVAVFFYAKIWLNNFPVTFIQNIFEKGKTGNLDFLAQSQFFVEPNPITELKTVDQYFISLQVKLKASPDSYIYKINQKREQHNSNEIVKVFVMVSMGGSRINENEAEFVFCRYKWYQWTLIDFKPVHAT